MGTKRGDHRNVLSRARIAFVAFWALFFALGCLWALASPLASGPDESGHLVKAAASVRGQWTGVPMERGGETFRLPGDVGGVAELTCFAFRPDLPASCAPPLEAQGSAEIDAPSGVGSYNPLYYLFVGWPSLLLSGNEMVFAMRALNALLVSGFLALVPATILRLRPAARPWLLGVFGVALTPMTGYLAGVVNPSGTEVAAVLACAVLAWRVVSPTAAPAGTRTAVLLAASVAIAANLRATTPLYLVLVLIPVLIAADWTRLRRFAARRATVVCAGIAVAGGLAGVAWSLLVGLEAGYLPSAGHERDDPLTAFVRMLTTLPGYGREMVGVFGWLDTQLLEVTYVGWAMLIGFVVIGGLALARERRLIAAIFAVAMVVLVPAIIQAPATPLYGYIWQGRYGLPLLVAALLLLGMLAAESSEIRADGWPRRASVLVWSAWLVVTGGAFFTALRRYMTGTEADVSDLFIAPAWSPPLGAPVVFGAFLVVCAVVAAYAIVLGGPPRPAPETSDAHAPRGAQLSR